MTGFTGWDFSLNLVHCTWRSEISTILQNQSGEKSGRSALHLTLKKVRTGIYRIFGFWISGFSYM